MLYCKCCSHSSGCEHRYGEVDRVVGSNAFVKIADEVFVMLEKANAIWCFVPDEHLSRAKVMVRPGVGKGR